MPVDQAKIKSIVQAINMENEKTRRFDHDKRHQIYLDGGKQYLIEQLQREFDRDGLDELRLAPINFLKKIISKKSQVYRSAPFRMATTNSDSDQALIEYYEKELALDVHMQKANKYYNLHANTAIYCFPDKGLPRLAIVPPFLYSIVPDPFDQTMVKAWIFGRFNERDIFIQEDDLNSATGAQGWERDRSGVQTPVADNARHISNQRELIWWTDDQHFTTDNEGNVIRLDREKGDEQFMNPIGRAPVIHLQKSTDGEPWSEVGGDMVDLQMALALGWTDVLSIAKHQGFSIMTVTSPDRPQKMKVGINKIMWLKQIDGQPTPTVSYLQAQSPLAEYKELLTDLLGLLLSTNDISPSTIGGKMSGNITSGFQAMIEQSDAIECMRSDQPILRDAETDLWQVIKEWHNWMFDQPGVLRDDARALGKFSDDFDVQINYQELRPIESESERIQTVKELRSEKLITRKDSLKKLHPDMTEEQIDKKLAEIDQEGMERAQRALELMPQMNKPDTGDTGDTVENETENEEEKDGAEGQV